MKQVEQVINALRFVVDNGWAKEPITLPSPMLNWADSIFGVDAIKWMLTKARISEECFRVVIDGQLQPHRKYTRPIVVGDKVATYVMDGSKVTKALQGGGSLILAPIEEYWEPVRSFCKDLGAKMGTRCSSFCVITPPEASGFVPHSDRTDQLVIQCQGFKSWKVFDIVERKKLGLEIDMEWIGEPTLEVVLKEGEMLYLPQGAAHVAQSMESLSVHLTLTFEPITTGKWIEAALHEVLATDSESAVSLPPFYYEDTGSYLDELAIKCREVLEKVHAKTKQIATHDFQKATTVAEQCE